MAGEHENNKQRGQQQQQQGQQPEKKPPATPAAIAKLTGEISALVADLYPAEQTRILRAVAITNNLDLLGKRQ